MHSAIVTIWLFNQDGILYADWQTGRGNKEFFLLHRQKLATLWIGKKTRTSWTRPVWDLQFVLYGILIISNVTTTDNWEEACSSFLVDSDAVNWHNYLNW